MKPTLVLPAALALLAAALPAGADELHLKNGRTLEGKVTEAGDTVVIERPGMRMELRRDEVDRVVRTPTAREAFAGRRRALEEEEREEAAARKGAPETDEARAKRIEARHRLGLWAKEQGLGEEARREQEAVLALDPDHAGARRALGFVKWEGEWRLEDELMTERGFVRVGGEWLPKEEAERKASDEGISRAERERRAARDRDRGHRRALNAALRQVAHADPEVRAAGEKSLVALAREMEVPELEAKAPEIRGYYDRVYAAIDRARATVEIRAQLVTLKRPIPTFRTSLGGFTSPVTLQLPEVSVVRINTTAVLPLQVDED